MHNRAIRLVIFTGSLAILSILGFQFYWITTNWKIEEQAIDQKIQIALRKVAGIIADYNQSELPAEDVIYRRSTNYYLVNVNDHIDANLLEFYTRRALSEVELHLDFEYAIYDCDENRMVYGDYCSADAMAAAEPTGDLPHYDKYTYYFGIQFPQLRGLIISQMNITIVLGALLLLTLLFFAYSLYVILSQKRITDLQKEFINNMTHEFKTPISTISIGAKTFLENEQIEKDPRLKKYAEIILSQAGRLDSQVEKVLDLARLEKDQFRLKKERLDLGQIVESIVSGQQNKFQVLEGNLIFKMDDEPLIIEADALHLSNVIHNLIDNSLKYHNGKPEVVVEVRRVGKKVQFGVKDKGLGIAKTEQSKIFDKFYRVPTGNVHNTKGFGLGLYYVRQICKLHNWELELESELGVGTEFRIIMPYAGT